MPRSNNASAQTRKYNGKELVTTEGMNEYDCEARWYNPIVMRTGTIDPHAENYYHLSPYSWCGNNPINAIDPNGMDSIYIYDRQERPLDNGTNEETYTADIVVVIDGEEVGIYRGSSYPNSISNDNNSTNYNTIAEGEYEFNNIYGHKNGTEKGLNLVDNNGDRQVAGYDPVGNKVTIYYANIHKGKSNNGNFNSRGSMACITIHPADAEMFFSHFVWTNKAKTTGTSHGKVFIIRNRANKE